MPIIIASKENDISIANKLIGDVNVFFTYSKDDLITDDQKILLGELLQGIKMLDGSINCFTCRNGDKYDTVEKAKIFLIECIPRLEAIINKLEHKLTSDTLDYEGNSIVSRLKELMRILYKNYNPIHLNQEEKFKPIPHCSSSFSSSSSSTQSSSSAFYSFPALSSPAGHKLDSSLNDFKMIRYPSAVFASDKITLQFSSSKDVENIYLILQEFHGESYLFSSHVKIKANELIVRFCPPHSCTIHLAEILSLYDFASDVALKAAQDCANLACVGYLKGLGGLMRHLNPLNKQLERMYSKTFSGGEPRFARIEVGRSEKFDSNNYKESTIRAQI